MYSWLWFVFDKCLKHENVEYKVIQLYTILIYLVSDLEITNICSQANYVAAEGYISTPNFPNEYPPGMDCVCTLKATTSVAQIRLEATHFIVKYDNPCEDWLEISMVGRTRRLCGAYRSTLRSNSFNLTFHSDNEDGHQGVWLYYSSTSFWLCSFWQYSELHFRVLFNMYSLLAHSAL